MKLNEKLEDLKKGVSTEPVSTKTKSKKRIANKKPENSQRSEDKNLVFCSLCAEHISNYIPEYFCGEKYNPACERCKANDSSWAPDDPFASFPSETLPSSLVSHFILHLPSKPPQNPSSISTLISHCVKLPNPGDRFISVQEAFEMMMKRLDSDLTDMK